MVLQLDELQQAVKLLQAFTQDSQHYLRHLSEQLGKRESLSGGVWKSRWGSLTGVNERFPPVSAARTFQQLVNSPVRKLIAAPPLRKTPAPEG